MTLTNEIVDIRNDKLGRWQKSRSFTLNFEDECDCQIIERLLKRPCIKMSLGCFAFLAHI